MTHHLLIERMKESMPVRKQKAFEINMVLFALRYYCAQTEETSLYKCLVADRLIKVYDLPANFRRYNFNNRKNIFECKGCKSYKYTKALKVFEDKQERVHNQVTKYSDALKILKIDMSVEGHIKNRVNKLLKAERGDMEMKLKRSKELTTKVLNKLKRSKSTIVSRNEFCKTSNSSTQTIGTKSKSKGTQKSFTEFKKLKEKLARQTSKMEELKHELTIEKNRHKEAKDEIIQLGIVVKAKSQIIDRLNNTIVSIMRDHKKEDTRIRAEKKIAIKRENSAVMKHKFECLQRVRLLNQIKNTDSGQRAQQGYIESLRELRSQNIQLRKSLDSACSTKKTVSFGCQTEGLNFVNETNRLGMLQRQVASYKIQNSTYKGRLLFQEGEMKEKEGTISELREQLNKIHLEKKNMENRERKQTKKKPKKSLKKIPKKKDKNKSVNVDVDTVLKLIESNTRLTERVTKLVDLNSSLNNRNATLSSVPKRTESWKNTENSFRMALIRLKEAKPQRAYYNYLDECGLYGGECVRDCADRIKNAILKGRFHHSKQFMDMVSIHFKERERVEPYPKH